MNDQILWVVVIVVFVAFVLLRMRGSISADKARQLLSEGGVVVDVRTREEFASHRLKKAVNIPLAELGQRIRETVPDKSVPVLVHCASGARSAAAVGQLRRLGYERAYNIGSFHKAKSIVGS